MRGGQPRQVCAHAAADAARGRGGGSGDGSGACGVGVEWGTNIRHPRPLRPPPAAYHHGHPSPGRFFTRPLFVPHRPQRSRLVSPDIVTQDKRHQHRGAHLSISDTYRSGTSSNGTFYSTGSVPTRSAHPIRTALHTSIVSRFHRSIVLPLTPRPRLLHVLYHLHCCLSFGFALS
jgi:hypothetical protein